MGSMPKPASCIREMSIQIRFQCPGLDFDALKASAIAYINANTLVQKENAGEMGRELSPTVIFHKSRGNKHDKEIVTLAGDGLAS